MSELLTQTTELLDQASKADAAAQAEALSEYRTLLARADAPKKGDAERLPKLLATLKLTLADVKADVAALAEGRRLKSVVDAQSDAAFSDRFAAAGTALTSHREAAAKRHRDDEAETGRLLAATQALSQDRDTWHRQRSDLTKLRAANPRIPL